MSYFSQVLLYVISCLLGVFDAFHPTILSGFAKMQAHPVDTRLNNYFLEHTFQILTNKNYTGEIFSPAFFYPYKNVLAFSDNLFGSAPIYFILRLFLTPDLSYQLWMIVVCSLCFLSFAVLMRYYRVNHVLTVVGAFLFAFGLPRIVQISHQQLLPQFFTPLAFLFAWDFIRRPRNKSLAWTLLFVYLQILAGIYLGWFLMFTLAIFAGIVYLLDSKLLLQLTLYFKHNYKVATSIVTAWLLLMVLLLAPYIQIQEILGSRTYGEIDSMLPRLSSWFLPAPDSLWWSLLLGYSQDLPMVQEHHMFLGFLIILLTALSIYILLNRKNILSYERSFLSKACLLVALTIFIITLRLPNGWSIWRIIYEVVPGASAIRAVTRIWTMFYFYLIVGVMLCLDSLLQTILKKQLRTIVLSLLYFGCLLEQIVISPANFELAPFTQEIAQIQELMQNNCDVAYVYTTNVENPFWSTQVSAMWAGIKANIPVVNGYSGNFPPNYGDIGHSMNTDQVINWLGKTNKKRLCIISQKSLKEKDNLLSMYSFKESIKASGSWIYYQINLPISKIFSQHIKVEEFPKTWVKGSEIKIPIVVKNLSNFLWSNKGDNPTNLSYHWIDSNGRMVVLDGERTFLPFDLSVGKSAALNAVIRTPSSPGKYTLVLTMVQESVAWFSDKQADSQKIDVTITSN